MTTIAIDCGGTFTDLVYLDETGEVRSAKARSTPRDFSAGTLDAVADMAARLGAPVADLLGKLDLFAYSSTVATNMLITRSGARTGLITTKGFEDTLFIGRIFQKIAGLKEQEMINMAHLDKAEPIIPRQWVKGVTERVDYKGKVIVPLNTDEVNRAVEDLVRSGAEAIAVATMWSFMNPTHEIEIRRLIKAFHPGLFVSISSELAPVIGEYERMATTAVNAYIGPVNSRMFTSLADKLRQAGLGREPVMMQGSGGYTTGDQAAEKPVLTLSSGPAGGLVAAMAYSELLGENIITADVGGTSFDVGLVIKGQAEFAARPVFGQYNLCLPLLDISSIGAGGGSIAWIEPVTGRLKVGPQSAGADPGPVCYAQGGKEPTVTDADFVLGRYNPGNFLGGRVKVDPGLAAQALKLKVADPLGMSLLEAAMGVVDIVDANMAGLVRKITVGRGHDPQKFVLLSFGGAGPGHVGSFAPAVGVKRVVIPRNSSVFSALGIATSDVVYIREISDPVSSPFSAEKLNDIFSRLENDVLQELERVGMKPENISLIRSADMKYKGQVHEVRTPVPAGSFTPEQCQNMVATFEQAYENKYGRGTTYKAAGIQALTWRVSGRGRAAKPAFRKYVTGTPDPSGAGVGRRDVYFGESRSTVATDIYDREKLRPGNIVKGPAVIEGADTTIVVHPGQTARMDEYLNTVLEW